MIILILAHCVQAAGTDEGTLAAAIRSAAEANRAAFTRGEAHFRIRVGFAKDARRGRAGDWTPAGTARGYYAFDGSRARFERVYTVEDMVTQRRPVGGGATMSALNSMRLLTDGTATLWDVVGVAADNRSVTHMAQISDGAEVFFRQVLFPVDLDRRPGEPSRLEEDFRRSGDAGADWKLKEIDDRATLDGADVARLTFAGGAYRRDYLVDLEHGAVVRQMTDLSDRDDVLFQINQDDVRQSGERGWLPYRMTVLIPAPSGCSVKDLVIDDADFESVPAPDAFRLEFPAPVPMIHQGKLVRYEPQKVWDLARLPLPSSGRAKPIVLSQPAPPAPSMPGPQRQRWPFAVPAALFGLILLAMASFLYRRNRARV